MIQRFLANLDTVKGLQIFKLMRFTFAIVIRILLAKTYLTVEAIGLYDTLLFVSGTFTFFWISGLLDGLLAAFPKFAPEEQPIFLFNVFLLFMGLSIVVSGLLWVFQPEIVALLTKYPEPTLPYFGILCIFTAINIPTYLVEFIYLLKNKPFPILSFGLLAFGGQVLVVVLPVALGYSLEYSFWGLLLLGGLKFIWLIYVLFKYTEFKVKLANLSPYLSIALPLILYFFIGGIMDYIDRAIVSKLFGEASLAIYESGAKEFPISVALAGAMASALIPAITENLQNGLEEIKRRTLKIMHPLFLMTFLLTLTAPLLFPIVFNPDFTPSAFIFNIYLLILGSRILLPQTILIGLKKTKVILWVSVLEIMVNLGLSLYLVQFWGLEGIAFATFVAFFLEKIFLIAYAKFQLNIPLSQYCHTGWYGFYLTLLFMVYGFSLWIY